MSTGFLTVKPKLSLGLLTCKPKGRIGLTFQGVTFNTSTQGNPVKTLASGITGSALNIPVSYTYTPPSATVVLVHFDGTNGSTSIPTAIGSGATAESGAALTTSEHKFGSASLAMDGGFQGVNINLSQAPGFADWTVEFFIKGAAISNLGLGTNFIGTPSASTIRLRSFVGTTIATITLPALTPTSWTHVAFVRHGTGFKIFYDGISVHSSTPYGSTQAVGFCNGINVYNAGSTSNFMYLDELRVGLGIATYTANFTPPSAPFIF